MEQKKNLSILKLVLLNCNLKYYDEYNVIYHYDEHYREIPPDVWTQNHPTKLFIFPAAKYRGLFRHPNGNRIRTQDLLKIDRDNIYVIFEYLNYAKELKIYSDKIKTFDWNIHKLKYNYMKSFFYHLCDFVLSTTCQLYYSDLYKFNTSNVTDDFLDLRGGNVAAQLFGPNSKGVDFSFDKAFGYALELETKIRKHFLKMINFKFPELKIDDNSIFNEKKFVNNNKKNNKKNKKKDDNDDNKNKD